MSEYIFKRYESKYIISNGIYNLFLKRIMPYLKLDEYGLTNIKSLYYDTENYLLIRNSIEQPVYKEKLRIRTYGKIDDNSNCFIELKKKYEGIVYKRRIKTKYELINDFFTSNNKKNQIEKEIIYFYNFYKPLKPKMLISCNRLAYIDDKSDLRITFDFDITYKISNLDLKNESNGIKILNDNLVLMEIKTAYSYPIWLTKILSDLKIYKTGFSKYGEAYKLELNKNIRKSEEKYVSINI